jgi:sigma-E factor negative regulatory protein RseA
MNTREMSREQISALADGELADAHVNVALAALREPEAQVTWDLYHQIGDSLRSDDMAFELSDGFAARMRARLEAEPVILSPQLSRAAEGHAVVHGMANGVRNDMHSTDMRSTRSRKHFMRRFVMPGAAVAAAVVAVVFVAAPQLTMINNGGTVAAASPMAVGSGVGGGITTVAAAAPTAVSGAVHMSSLAQQGEVVRDSRIDEYLLTHQRFSPSMYSSAQYARSAGFAIDSDK